MNWKLALEQIAFVASETVAVREAGFTTAALAFPRTRRELVAICAFNGLTDPDKAPRGWHYYPNAGTAKAWQRVVAALDGEAA